MFWKKEGVLEVIVEVGLLAGNALWAILLLRLSCLLGWTYFTGKLFFLIIMVILTILYIG